MVLWDLFEFKLVFILVFLDQVESVESICICFCMGGMSLGVLFCEVYEVLVVVMNCIGGKSNSGEGGEDFVCFQIFEDVDGEGCFVLFFSIGGLCNGDIVCLVIKQVVLGCFGVIVEYLCSGKQFEIKVVQGVKFGEGGQLLGFKVDKYIVWLCNSKLGVVLILLLLYYDIYLIEDLVQLIYDLYQVYFVVFVSVKLVVEIGIGIIVVGVVKVNVDVIQIFGYDGGMGVFFLSLIKYVGSFWELGFIEVYCFLVENGLCDWVLLCVDGGLKIGWDVVIVVLLGVEEYGFGLIVMIVEGCVMVCVCYINNCFVGVVMQKENLCKCFIGIFEYVVNFFWYVVEEVCQLMSLFGVI